MTDELQEQLVNELRAFLQTMNVKYKGFFHCQLITLVDMEENTCDHCIENKEKCLRSVIGYECRSPSNT